MITSDQKIRQTAIEILAMAVCELFPETKLITPYITAIDFVYDFITPQPIGNQHIPIIEEKIREIKKRNLPIDTIEMISTNAKELLCYHDQTHRANQIKNSTQILSLIRIGNFYDIALDEINTNTSMIGHVIIEKIENLPNHVIRIHGSASSDKKTLRFMTKKKEKRNSWDHSIIGQTLNLFSFTENQTIIWHPLGAEFRNVIQSWLEKTHKQNHYQLLYTSPYEMNQHNTLHEKQIGSRFYEWTFKKNESTKPPHFRGLLSSEILTSDLGTLYCPKKEASQEFTSLLHFIKKIIKLLAFEHKWCFITREKRFFLDFSDIEEKSKDLKRFRVEVKIYDPLGQDWEGPWIEFDGTNGQAIIKHSITGSLEKIIALLIETHRGELPIWLRTEHVRFIPVNKRNIPYIEKMINDLEMISNCRSRCDDRSLNVGQRVNAALLEKVLFVAVIGDKEEVNETVTIRLNNKEITKLKTAFIEEIAEKTKDKV